MLRLFAGQPNAQAHAPQPAGAPAPPGASEPGSSQPGSSGNASGVAAERSRSPLQGHHRVLAFLRQRDQEAKATQEARDTLQYMRDQETAFGSDSCDDEASPSSNDLVYDSDAGFVPRGLAKDEGLAGYPGAGASHEDGVHQAPA